MEPPPMPGDLVLKDRIDKVAERVVMSPNGLELESLMRVKQTGNQQFSFLQPNGQYYEYYQFKKQTIHQSQGGPPPPTMNPMGGPPLPLPPPPPSQQMTQQPPIHTFLPPPQPPPPGAAGAPFPPPPHPITPHHFDIRHLDHLLRTLDGSRDCIKNVCRYMRTHKTHCEMICNQLQHFILSIPPHDFNKKLFTCYAINDVLHESMNDRISQSQPTDNQSNPEEHLSTMDLFSLELAKMLKVALPYCYTGYNPDQQSRVLNLVNLWRDRKIFNSNYTNELRSALINADPYPTPQNGTLSNHIQPNVNSWPVGGLTGPPPPGVQTNDSIMSNTTTAMGGATTTPNFPSWVTPPNSTTSVASATATTASPTGVPLSAVKNALNISIAITQEVALDLRRHGGGGTYVPIPIDKYLSGTRVLSAKNEMFKRRKLQQTALKAAQIAKAAAQAAKAIADKNGGGVGEKKKGTDLSMPGTVDDDGDDIMGNTTVSAADAAATNLTGLLLAPVDANMSERDKESEFGLDSTTAINPPSLTTLAHNAAITDVMSGVAMKTPTKIPEMSVADVAEMEKLEAMIEKGYLEFERELLLIDPDRNKYIANAKGSPKNPLKIEKKS